MTTPSSNLRRTLAALACFAALQCLATPAEAIAVRYRFEAEVGSLTYGDPDLVPIGTRFTASFIMRTDVPVPEPAPHPNGLGVTWSRYSFETGFSVDFPGFSFAEPWEEEAHLPEVGVSLWDNYDCLGDYDGPCSPEDLGLRDGIRVSNGPFFYDPVRKIRLLLDLKIEDLGPNPSLIDGLEIPAVIPFSPTAVGTGSLWLTREVEGPASGKTRFGLIDVTVSVVVPEPPRGLPLLAGLLAIGWLGRVPGVRIAR